jgi:hypothetical protein
VEYTIKAAFERMLVCANRECAAYGDDTPDWAPGDTRCLICATAKDHWTRVPFKDLKPDLQRCLAKLELTTNEPEPHRLI